MSRFKDYYARVDLSRILNHWKSRIRAFRFLCEKKKSWVIGVDTLEFGFDEKSVGRSTFSQKSKALMWILKWILSLRFNWGNRTEKLKVWRNAELVQDDRDERLYFIHIRFEFTFQSTAESVSIGTKFYCSDIISLLKILLTVKTTLQIRLFTVGIAFVLAWEVANLRRLSLCGFMKWGDAAGVCVFLLTQWASFAVLCIANRACLPIPPLPGSYLPGPETWEPSHRRKGLSQGRYIFLSVPLISH